MDTSVTAAFGLPPLHDPGGYLEKHPRLINSTKIDAQIAAPLAPLKADPDIASETLSYLIKGEPLQILGDYKNWHLVVSVIDGYLGWLDQNAATSLVTEPTHRVSTTISHVYSSPDLKSQPLSALVMGSFIDVTGSAVNDFLPTGNGGWIFQGNLTVIGTAENKTPLEIAETFIGAPYLWGGRSALGIDCSGLIQISLASCGKRIHRDSDAQHTSLGRQLENDEHPTRGDLAFFPGHVGWMINATHVLHANATHMAVTIDPVEDIIQWISTKTGEQAFCSFKRLRSR